MAPTRRRRSTRSPAGGAGVTRAHDLPTAHANELLAGFKGKLHTVKTQELKLEDGSTIIIARVKVPTPKGISGHLIRRFDTDALSASSLFRAAFPNAEEDAEQEEMAYLIKKYNTKAAGDEDETGSGKLTGTWVPTEDAANLAKEYGITKFATELITYKHTSGQDNGAASSPAAPTPSKAKSPAPTSARSKRQRVTSPPMSTRSSTTNMQALQAPPSTSTTPSKSTRSKAAAAAQAPAVPDEKMAETADSDETGGIQITQEIITDETTGVSLEETKVTFTGKEGKAAAVGEGSEGLIGTEDQAREAAENALKLIESLKEQGTLQSSTSKRVREEEDGDAVVTAAAGEEAAEEDDIAEVGVLKRWLGRKPKSAKRSRPSQARREIGELQVMQSPDGAQVLVAQTTAPVQPVANRRRYIAMAGMVVMGAATAAAPYFF